VARRGPFTECQRTDSDFSYSTLGAAGARKTGVGACSAPGVVPWGAQRIGRVADGRRRFAGERRYAGLWQPTGGICEGSNLAENVSFFCVLKLLNRLRI
jgi:hypothetical protein